MGVSKLAEAVMSMPGFALHHAIHYNTEANT